MRLPFVLAAVLLLLVQVAAAAEPPLEPSDINSRYMLMDGRGRAISNEDFPGRFQLISFGYTFCPDVCPTTLAAMTQILRQLGDRAEKLQPIFITVDPERDTREVMAKYTAYFDPRIVGLTGPVDYVRAAADHYRIVYRKYRSPNAAPGDYSIDHTAGMTLLGPDGSFVARFAHGDAPQDIAKRIAELMAQDDGRQTAKPKQ
jgi:protein SCO1/2